MLSTNFTNKKSTSNNLCILDKYLLNKQLPSEDDILNSKSKRTNNISSYKYTPKTTPFEHVSKKTKIKYTLTLEHLEDVNKQDTIEWTRKFGDIINITKWDLESIAETTSLIIHPDIYKLKKTFATTDELLNNITII